jgi:hypothetical protein
MNLRYRLQLAFDSLLAILDPEKDLMPAGGYEVAHDLGRWWDAVLRVEEAIGAVIPAELEAASLSNLSRLTDNPDRLLMNRTDVSWLSEKAKLNPHNFRETFLAFGGLVRVRRSLWAKKAALTLVESMDRSLQEDGRLDFTKLGSWGSIPDTTDPSHAQQPGSAWFDGTATSGRSLEALVWLYESTRDKRVLNLASRIAEHHLAYSTTPQGDARPELIDPNNVGHNHSYHGTLRGLLLYGLLTDQRRYVDVVESTYRNAIRYKIVKESGWTPHDLGKLRFPNEHGDPVTDPASTGDATQLALWLALRAGCDDLLDDVERYVRGRLLPEQATPRDVETGGESYSPRNLGAWCIHGPSHGGKGCTPDVLAAVTHSLCDIYQNICTCTATGTRINLHFDYEDSNIRITSTRNDRGELEVAVKHPTDLLIRIPGWASADSVRLSVDGNARKIRRQGGFARINRDELRASSLIIMEYALPIKTSEETMPSGRTYRFAWRGDEIIGADPRDEPRPFYPPMPGS